LATAVAFYLELGPEAPFEQKERIVESTLLGFGLLSVWLLIAQLRQTTSWNRVLSYHDYFGELPSSDRANQLYLCLHRLDIPVPSCAAPISRESAEKLWTDEGIEGRDGTYRQVGERVIREYLNDFEEFCGAIRACVVSESYACELEGDRTINAYFAFEEVIKIIRKEAEASGRAEARGTQDDAAMERRLQLYRRSPYLELRTIAISWRSRREKEYRKLSKKRRAFEKSMEDQESFDAVGPST
jgi:hypothetical protein